MNTRRRLLMSQAVQSTPVTADNYVAGDIAFYDSTDDKIVLVHNEDINTDTYPTARYTPIGVVVIPNSHDVYGDGSCGVISLMEMSCDTPDTGSRASQIIVWGRRGNDIQDLPNLTRAPFVGEGYNAGDASSTIISTTQYPYLPTDRDFDILCPHDTNTKYYGAGTGFYQAPSCYLTDGSRNTAYYQTTEPSSQKNYLSDFNGTDNTDKITIQRGTKDYSSWKPTYNSESDYPAASCCDMFYTNGTKQGDWYLPAMGELGYVITRFNKIYTSFVNIKNIYGNSICIELSESSTYWSSTEFSDDAAVNVNTSTCRISNGSKYTYSSVRAFIRIKPDGTITSRTTTS